MRTDFCYTTEVESCPGALVADAPDVENTMPTAVYRFRQHSTQAHGPSDVNGIPAHWDSAYTIHDEISAASQYS